MSRGAAAGGATWIFSGEPQRYEPEHGARIGLVDSHDGLAEWFDVESGVVLHGVNAHVADDGRVVVRALRSIPSTPTSFIGAYTPAFLYEWVLDPATGRCASERYLSALSCEFPAADPRALGEDVHCCFVRSHGVCLDVSRRRRGPDVDIP